MSAFSATDKAFLDIARRRKMMAGSTAIVAFIVGNASDSLTLHVANAGDCRAVLCRAGRPVRQRDIAGLPGLDTQ